jgi:hypothetical protein
MTSAIFESRQDPGLADHEAAVDPTFAGPRLLGEAFDPVALESHLAEPRWRMDRSDRRSGTVRSVMTQQSVEIDVGESVAIGIMVSTRHVPVGTVIEFPPHHCARLEIDAQEMLAYSAKDRLMTSPCSPAGSRTP